jgi:hypothetical protein
LLTTLGPAVGVAIGVGVDVGLADVGAGGEYVGVGVGVPVGFGLGTLPMLTDEPNEFPSLSVTVHVTNCVVEALATGTDCIIISSAGTINPAAVLPNGTYVIVLLAFDVEETIGVGSGIDDGIQSTGVGCVASNCKI